MNTDEPKPLTDEEDVALWDALCTHTPPEGASRWWPDKKEDKS